VNAQALAHRARGGLRHRIEDRRARLAWARPAFGRLETRVVQQSTRFFFQAAPWQAFGTTALFPPLAALMGELWIQSPPSRGGGSVLRGALRGAVGARRAAAHRGQTSEQRAALAPTGRSTTARGPSQPRFEKPSRPWPCAHDTSAPWRWRAQVHPAMTSPWPAARRPSMPPSS